MEALQTVDEPDTLVIDPERDDDMIVHGDDGAFHRVVTLDKSDHLACGPALDFRLRQGVGKPFDWPLCPTCFTRFEVDESNRRKRERDARAMGLGSQPIPTIAIPPKGRRP